MSKMTNNYIVLKETLNQNDYDEISHLQQVCLNVESISLKLELDYKLSMSKQHENIKNINEFLYYDSNKLIGYIGLCQFFGNVIEINGMIHPNYRNQGIFSRLFSLVLDEWKKRESDKILLLCDRQSRSGQQFIQKTGAIYDHSEYDMTLKNDVVLDNQNKALSLRVATHGDAIEIARQNAIYFNMNVDESQIEERVDDHVYLAILNDKIIGKVHFDIHDNHAVIFGLGVKPEFRKQGYGKAILLNSIKILREYQANQISLQVDAINKNALNLYKSCGFEESTVMDYYYLMKNGMKI